MYLKIKTFVYQNFLFFIIIFSIISVTAITKFWWLSCFSITFFLWNLLSERKHLAMTIVIITFTILLNLLNFKILKPFEDHLNKDRIKYSKVGYDAGAVQGSQEKLNVFVKIIEEYYLKYGYYPKDLSSIDFISVMNNDFSYKVKRKGDGLTWGVPFHYTVIDSNHYFLGSVGQDGIINTNDDLLPQISKEQEKTIGLVKYHIKTLSPKEQREQNNLFQAYKKGEKIKEVAKDGNYSIKEVMKIWYEK
jgi:hypothetical protein